MAETIDISGQVNDEYEGVLRLRRHYGHAMDDFGPHQFDTRFSYPRWIDAQEVHDLLPDIKRLSVF